MSGEGRSPPPPAYFSERNNGQDNDEQCAYAERAVSAPTQDISECNADGILNGKHARPPMFSKASQLSHPENRSNAPDLGRTCVEVYVKITCFKNNQ